MFRCVEVGLPSKWNRLPSRRSETPVKTEETPVVLPRDSRHIGVRLPSMAARTPAASVREANIHSSRPDLYTGVFNCVLTSEDCEDWKLREHFTCSYFRWRRPRGFCATRGNEKSTRGAAFLHKGKRKLHKGRRAAPPGEAKHPIGLGRTPRREGGAPLPVFIVLCPLSLLWDNWDCWDDWDGEQRCSDLKKMKMSLLNRLGVS